MEVLETKFEFNEQTVNAYRMAQLLMSVPESQRAIVIASANAYIDGIGTGRKIAGKLEEKRKERMV